MATVQQVLGGFAELMGQQDCDQIVSAGPPPPAAAATGRGPRKPTRKAKKSIPTETVGN
jgi:hypothetical protein